MMKNNALKYNLDLQYYHKLSISDVILDYFIRNNLKLAIKNFDAKTRFGSFELFIEDIIFRYLDTTQYCINNDLVDTSNVDLFIEFILNNLIIWNEMNLKIAKENEVIKITYNTLEEKEILEFILDLYNYAIIQTTNNQITCKYNSKA